ncbi:DNA ligase [Shewanella sp. Actino-trap-3]|jgi:DNA ligase-1|uniref:DNA ligase n=1 Tax=Shewanella sp. Actino-trap-3 TaxID=2058331 RepID=UPI000C32CDF6|nr:DNA ligase [Shewanella sp. Actino-trap-3]PKG77156.1 DNA ligase [Shewanella sp. Actino-trap-3]|tara:strand:+ start:20495 stop:21343 length:849 start_codon:yes stop_codon:yes gene_type:complete
MRRIPTLLFSLIVALYCLPTNSEVLSTPPIQLATQYQQDTVVAEYLVSEKLDGVRGYWDGSNMLTRSGRKVALPASFTLGFPHVAIDGELWLGRNRFEQISALVRRQQVPDQEWQEVRFMMFDLPQHPGPFSERYSAMKMMVEQTASTHLQVIKQETVASTEALFTILDGVVNAGGEGLMLHYQQAHYAVGRSEYIIKLKPKYDAEAVVIGHTQGKGKYRGKLGALVVKTPAGLVFNVGSGLSDKQRENPPLVGSIITYQYLGFTQKGTPRFASFLRERPSQ